MRRFNAVLAMGILFLFIVHMVVGGFQLAGVLPGGSSVMKVLAYIMLVLIMLHFVIGTKLTVDSLRLIKKSGASYFKENKLFWVRRISGFAIMFFIVFHVLIFMGKSGSAYRLHIFEGAELLSQILLVITVAVHIISNVRPMMISFGIKSFKELGLDIVLVMSVLLFLAGAAFVVYYLRWNVL